VTLVNGGFFTIEEERIRRGKGDQCIFGYHSISKRNVCQSRMSLFKGGEEEWREGKGMRRKRD
jgi:hypothetical protein